MANRDRYFGGSNINDAFKTSADERKITIAIRQNDVATVVKFIAQGGDVDIPEAYDGSLPRHPVISRAATLGRANIVEALLKAGADVHQGLQFDAVTEAAREGQLATLKVFIDAGVDLNKSPFALNRAIAFNRPAVVDMLIAAKMDVSDALTALLNGPRDTASRTRIAQALINAGADTEAANYRGRTPLMEETDLAVIKLLAAGKANVNAQGTDGMTVLQAMIEKRNWADKEAAIKFLLTNGANPLLKNAHGESALDTAIQNRDVAVIRLLDPSYPVASLPADHEAQAFVIAAGRGNDIKTVEAFLNKYGPQHVDTAHRDGSSPFRTAFENAAIHSGFDAMALLHSNGADIMRLSSDHYHRTPMAWALDMERPEVAKFLIKLGAEIDAESRQIASRRGLLPVLERGIELRDAAKIRKADPQAPLPLPTADEIKQFQYDVFAGHIHKAGDFLDTFGAALLTPQGSYGDTALDIAVRGKNEDMVTALLDRGAKITYETLCSAIRAKVPLARVAKLLDTAPELVADASRQPPDTLMVEAILAKNEGVAGLLLDRKTQLWETEDGKIYEALIADDIGAKEIAALIRDRVTEPPSAAPATPKSKPKPPGL